MKKFLLLFLITTTSIFATPTQQLTHLLDQFKTLRANFTESTYDQQHQLIQTSHGTMAVKKPNFFRFETLSPTHQIVIANGQTLWVYDVDLQQATKQSLEKLPINPAKVLSGNASLLLQKFNVSMEIKANTNIFTLTPKQKSQAFSAIMITFVSDKLACMKVNTTLAQVNAFQFSNVMVNAPLSNALFVFKTPKGVDVLQ